MTRARRRRRASRRRVGTAHLERDPVGRPSLPLRPRPDRHDDFGGRLLRLRRAGTQRDGPDHGLAGGGGLEPGARAPRAVLPPSIRRFRRVERDLGGVLPGPAAGADDDRHRVHCTGDADRGRGRPPASRRESSRHRRWDLRALLCLLPPPPRRRGHDRRARARRGAPASPGATAGGSRPRRRARCRSPVTIYGLRALVRPIRRCTSGRATCPASTPWLLRFWTYCNDATTTAARPRWLLSASPCFDLVDGMIADGIRFDLWKLGMVCATSKKEDAQKVLRSLEGMRGYGYDLPDDVLGEDEIQRSSRRSTIA